MKYSFLLLAFVFGCGGSTPITPSTPPPVVVTPPVVTPPVVVVPPPPVVRGPEFSQTFWNQFVHDAIEGANIPLKRFTAAPSLYIRTVDGSGRTIDATTLNTVATAMNEVASTWGFPLTASERGTSSHIGDSNWITVQWLDTNAGAYCGVTKIGATSGDIRLNYLNPSCGCGGSAIASVTARHELGHAYGYYHTDSPSDVMYGGSSACDLRPSAREVYHASLAYQSPVGSTN